MAKISIEVSDDLEFIKRVPNVDWTVLVSKILKEKLKEIEEVRKIAANSALTEEDVESISDEINKNASRHYM